MKNWIVSLKGVLAMILCIALIVSSGILVSVDNVAADVGPPQSQLPADFEIANQQTPQRLGTLLEFLVQKTINEPIWNFPTGKGNPALGTSVFKDGSRPELDRILANLLSMKLWSLGLNDEYNLNTHVRYDMPDLVESLTESMEVWDGIGTNSFQNKKDFDMKLKTLTTILYTFRNPSDDEFLTDDAAFNIVKNAFTERHRLQQSTGVGNPLVEVVYNPHYYGTSDEYMIMDQPIIGVEPSRNPETENHVMMIYSSIYLVNQYVTNNYRNDSRFRPTDPNSPFYNWQTKWKNTPEFEDFLLNIIQRSVYSDYFEFNSRPYQGHTLWALMNLVTFAESDRIRQAARNTFDAFCARYAFSTLEGKRYGPRRRSSNNAEKVEDIGLYGEHAIDNTAYMMAMLSGSYVEDDTFENWFPDKDSYFFAHESSYALMGGLITDSTLMEDAGYEYDIPKQIHQFYFDKLDGFWSRIMPRYGDDYEHDNFPFEDEGNLDNSWANYFDEDGVRSIYEDMRFTPEAYFISNDFMHGMGGHYDDLPHDNDIPESLSEYNSHYFDGQTRATTIIPKGTVDFEGSDKISGPDVSMRDSIFYMSTNFQHHEDEDHNTLQRKHNLGTYKNFSFSDSYAGSLPVNVPNTRGLDQLWFESLGSSGDLWNDRIVYFIYDLRDQPENCFLIKGTIYDWDKGNYMREFWEIIPGHKYTNKEALKTYILANNSAQKVLSGDNATYCYKLITGEVVFPWKDTKDNEDHAHNPFFSIRASLADPSTVYDPYYYYFNSESPELHPLIDVRGVDEDYNFNGDRYCYSRGNGLWQIYNPHPSVGQEKYYIIDSRNIFAPYSTSSTTSQINMSVNMKSYNGEYRGIGVTIKTTANPTYADGNPGTKDKCWLVIEYKTSENVTNWKYLQIPKTKAGDSTTLYFYPPNGDVSKINKIEIRKNATSSGSSANDPWKIASVSIDNRGQAILHKGNIDVLNNTTSSPITVNLLDTDEKLSMLTLSVHTDGATGSETVNEVYFYIKRKDGAQIEYYLGNDFARGSTKTIDLGYYITSFSSIAEVGFRKHRQSPGKPNDDWKINWFNLKIPGNDYQNRDLFKNNISRTLQAPSNSVNVTEAIPVNQAGADYKDTISEYMGNMRVHLRRSESEKGTNEATPIILKIIYGSGEYEQVYLVPSNGFINPNYFEDTERDFMTSVNLKFPRKWVRSVELIATGGGTVNCDFLRLWLDGGQVFNATNFNFSSTNPKHWDDPTGF